MAKTGSTALQKFLDANSVALEKHGFRYSKAFRKAHLHRVLFQSFDIEKENTLREEYIQNSELILSFEDALVSPSSTIEGLARVADEIKIICYVRDPVHWLNSFLNQLIKVATVSYGQISEFLVDQEKNRVSRMDVGRHLERWESVVGRSNICVVPYDPTIRVIGSFLDWIGIPDTARKKFTFLTDNPNKAADIRDLKIILEIKRRLGEHNLDRRRFAIGIARKVLRERRVDTRVEPTLMLLTKEEQEAIHAFYAPAYEEIFARYGVEARLRVPSTRDVRQIDRGELTTLLPAEMKLVSKILRTARVKFFFKRCEQFFRPKKIIARHLPSDQR